LLANIAAVKQALQGGWNTVKAHLNILPSGDFASQYPRDLRNDRASSAGCGMLDGSCTKC